MTLINLADELIILLIFVNNEHFVNAVTIGKLSYADAAWAWIRSNLAKAIIRVYKK